MNRWISDERQAAAGPAYWLTIAWFTLGLALWIALRNDLWFVGFMSLYAIWITHLAGWAAETPVEPEGSSEGEETVSTGLETRTRSAH
jgi:hypothetical protein